MSGFGQQQSQSGQQQQDGGQSQQQSDGGQQQQQNNGGQSQQQGDDQQQQSSQQQGGANQQNNQNQQGGGAQQPPPLPGGDQQSQTPSGGNFLDGIKNKELLRSPALEGVTDLDTMAQRIVDLNSQLSMESVRIPGPNASKEDIDAFYKRLGRPDKPEDYALDPQEGLEEGVTVDPQLKNWFQNAAHKYGLTKAQATAFVKDWNGFINDGVKQNRQQFEHDSNATITQLQGEFGAAFKPALAAGSKIVRELGGEEMAKLMDNPLYGNNPAVLRLITNLGKHFGNDPKFVTGSPSGGMMMTPQEATAEARRIMNEADAAGKKPYWDKRHPQHNDYVQKVMNLYSIANGTEPQ